MKVSIKLIYLVKYQCLGEICVYSVDLLLFKPLWTVDFDPIVLYALVY